MVINSPSALVVYRRLRFTVERQTRTHLPGIFDRRFSLMVSRHPLPK